MESDNLSNCVSRKSIRISYIFVTRLMNRLLNFYAYIMVYDLKVVYHCFSCKEDFVNIKQAEEHSKSLRHEVTEEIQRSGKDDQLFLV
jgi:hypothetical protein